MKHTRPVAGAIAIFAASALLLSGVTTAQASHFRASGSSFEVAGDAATWTINSAWRADSGDYVFSDSTGDLLDVTSLAAYTDAPDAGADTGVQLELTDYAVDGSSDLFDASTEILEGDLASLGDGIYEVYAENCCRIGGVENTPTEDFSAWARFTKTGSTYDLPPVATNLTLYALLNTTGDTVIDFRATDPEGGSVGYTMLTDSNYPYYGADPLPCSTFTGGLLTVGPTYCTGGDVYADIYLKGTYWAVKIVASDSAGNQIALDSLLHVLNAPDPYIDAADVVGNGTVIDFWVDDNADEPLDSITIECVSTTDPTDVVTGTGTTNPIRVFGFTSGSEYNCAVSATNDAGSGTTGYDYGTGPITLDGVQIVTDLTVGDTLSGTELTLVGENLVPSSTYTLTQYSHPVVLYTGTASGAGAFSTPRVLDGSACIAGVHELVLAGVGFSGTVTDTVWYEVDNECRVVQFSRSGPVSATITPALAATGETIEPGLWSAAPAALLAGLALIAFARRRPARA